MKISVDDAAADVSSASSLSFAGFVSEQDKDSSTPQKEHVQPPVREERASQEFEFSSVVPNRRYSNGQLQHQREKPTCGRSSTAEPCLAKSTRKPNTGVKSGTEKKRGSSSGFGQKIINSFACKDCRAIEPIHPRVAARATR